MIAKQGRLLATLVSLAMVVLLSLTLAQTVLFFLENSAEVSVPKLAAQPRAASNSPPAIDLSRLSLFGKYVEEVAPAPVNAPETKLNLVLQGVFTADDPAQSTAIVAQKNKAGDLYAIGDKLPGNARLEAVFDDHILIRRGGRVEKLTFDDAEFRFSAITAPTAQNSPTTASNTGDSSRLKNISERIAERKAQSQSNARASTPGQQIRNYISSNRNKIEENPQQYLSQYGMEPVKTGNASGYRVGGAAAGTLSQAGLQPGDVVLTVNGTPVGNAMQDTALIDQALAAGRVRVEVQRNSRRFFLTVPIPQ